jgi:hypothetical protein
MLVPRKQASEPYLTSFALPPFFEVNKPSMKFGDFFILNFSKQVG